MAFAHGLRMDVARQGPRKRRGAVAAGAVGLLAAAVVGLSLWRAPADRAPRVPKSGVWTERVKRGDLLRQVPVQGALVPEHINWLSAASAARVAELPLRPGAIVDPESVVVILENADLELAALEAERQAASAEAALIQLEVRTDSELKAELVVLAGLKVEQETAERHALASEALAKQAMISGAEHQDAVALQAGLRARVTAEEARRQLLEAGRARQLKAQAAELERLKDIAAFRRRQLAALKIRAGIHGILQEIPLEIGQWVAVGALLAKVAEPDRLKADVRVAESSVRDLSVGLAVRFESSGGNIRGHLTRIDPAVVAGTVRLEVLFDDALPAGARAAQAIFGYVEIERLQDVLYVARPSGVQDEALAGIYRLESDHSHATRITAQLGRGSAKEVEIKSGLSEGEEIVVSDVSGFDMSPRVRLED